MIGVLVCINVMLVAALVLALLEQRAAFVRGYDLGKKDKQKAAFDCGFSAGLKLGMENAGIDLDEEEHEERESQPECWQ